MEKHVNLNKLLNQPYIEWKHFSKLVKNISQDKQLICSYGHGEETFHLAFMLIKLSSGTGLNFVNCDLNYESFFKLINQNSYDIEDFLVNYLINQINKLKTSTNEVYKFPFDYPGLYDYLNPSYRYNKNLIFILNAIDKVERNRFPEDECLPS